MLYEWPAGWEIKPDHWGRAAELGVSRERVKARAAHCASKAFPHGFADPDKQFMRELAWEAKDAEQDRGRNWVRKRAAQRQPDAGVSGLEKAVFR